MDNRVLEGASDQAALDKRREAVDLLADDCVYCVMLVPDGGQFGRLPHMQLKIQVSLFSSDFALSCFHSASTGGGNANVAPEGSS